MDRRARSMGTPWGLENEGNSAILPSSLLGSHATLREDDCDGCSRGETMQDVSAHEGRTQLEQEQKNEGEAAYLCGGQGEAQGSRSRSLP